MRRLREEETSLGRMPGALLVYPFPFNEIVQTFHPPFHPSAPKIPKSPSSGERIILTVGKSLPKGSTALYFCMGAWERGVSGRLER
jgi:hypothetical protein